YYLTIDKLEPDNAGIVLNNFSIEDQNHHNLTIDGSIATENLTNPGFDLNVSADNFQLMNSSQNDSVDYYGSLNFDVNGTITGKMSFPEVELDVRGNKKNELTCALSASQIAMK